jgi:hypothetical protein
MKGFVAIHPLDPKDASAIIPDQNSGAHYEGMHWTVDARPPHLA